MPANAMFIIAGGNPPNPGTGGTEASFAFDSSLSAFKIFDGTTLWAIPAGSTNDAVISATASTLAVTAALHAGRTVVLNRSGGVAVTLPAATGSGNRYRFIVGTASNANTINVTGNDTFGGTAIINDTGDSSAATVDAFRATSGTTNKISPTTAGGGGLVGDIIEVEDIATDVWFTRCTFQSATDPVTPFSAV